jgi:membrane protein implicated in regulation of membrane protease activity
MPIAAWVWFVVAAGLGVAELMTLTFAFAMVSAACVFAGIAAALGAPGIAQAGVAVVAGGAGLALVRPVVARHLHGGGSVRTGAGALPGAAAVATMPVSSDGGQVRLDGVLWRARLAYDSSPPAALPAGSDVVVASVDGATLVVYPTESP